MLKWTDEQLISAVKSSKSFKQAAIKLGLTDCRANIKNRIIELNLDTSHFNNKKYTFELLKPIIEQSYSIAQVLRRLGKTVESGSAHSYLSKEIKELGLDTSHFTGMTTNRGLGHKGGPIKITVNESLVYDRNNGRREKVYILRRSMIEAGIIHKCELCFIDDSWNGQKLVLHIDHINGNPLDNTIKNLRFLCPNCHSQTPTFATKNRRNYDRT